jgi:hypothetical protein
LIVTGGMLEPRCEHVSLSVCGTATGRMVATGAMQVLVGGLLVGSAVVPGVKRRGDLPGPLLAARCGEISAWSGGFVRAGHEPNRGLE